MPIITWEQWLYDIRQISHNINQDAFECDRNAKTSNN